VISFNHELVLGCFNEDFADRPRYVKVVGNVVANVFYVDLVVVSKTFVLGCLGVKTSSALVVNQSGAIFIDGPVKMIV
jgi:hypothetical protein